MENPTIQLGNNSWATKKDNLLAYNKDEQSRFQAIELDFARSSLKNVTNRSGYLSEIAAGNPAIDFLNNPSGALLLEPQSTNLIPYSEDFSNNSWTAFDVTNAPNSITDPSGNLTATRITALSGINRAFQTIVVESSSASDRFYTGSFYIKSPNTTSCNIRVGGSTNNTPLTISSEWQKFEAQYTLFASSTFIRLGVTLQNENDIVDIAFAQVEEQPYATSYIYNNGNSAGETRTADSSSKIGLNNYINSQEGVFYFYGKTLADSNNNRFLSLSDNSGSNFIQIRVGSNNKLQCRVFKNSSGVGSAIDDSTTSTLNDYKCAIVWNSTKFALFVNGSKIGEQLIDASLTSNILDTLTFNNAVVNGYSKFEGKIKDLRVYSTALTDQELTDLTTI